MVYPEITTGCIACFQQKPYTAPKSHALNPDLPCKSLKCAAFNTRSCSSIWQKGPSKGQSGVRITTRQSENREVLIRKRRGPNQKTSRVESAGRRGQLDRIRKREGPNQDPRIRKRTRPNQKTPTAARAESENHQRANQADANQKTRTAESENVRAERDRLVGDRDVPNWNRSSCTYTYTYIYIICISIHIYIDMFVYMYMYIQYTIHATYMYVISVCM